MNDALYFWTHSPTTVGELRRLNREAFVSFPLPMLLALIQAGVNVDTEQDAVIEQYVHETESTVELRWAVKKDGKWIAILGEKGSDDFRAVAKRQIGKDT